LAAPYNNAAQVIVKMNRPTTSLLYGRPLANAFIPPGANTSRVTELEEKKLHDID
jgi:hypothetical protein